MADETSGNQKVKSGAGFDLQIIIIGLVIFLMCMGGSYFMFKSLLAPLLPGEEPVNSKGSAVLVEVGEFTTNVYDVNNIRFLKASVYIEVADKDAEKQVNAVMPVLKDEILSILSSQTVADLDVRNRDHLREEIKSRLNKRLGGGNKVTGVYFTSFITQ